MVRIGWHGKDSGGGGGRIKLSGNISATVLAPPPLPPVIDGFSIVIRSRVTPFFLPR